MILDIGSIMILVILMPLFAALVSFALNNKIVSLYTSLFTSLSSSCLAFAVAKYVMAGNIVKYNLGGWHESVGIELVANPLGAIILVMIQISYFCASISTYIAENDNRSMGSSPSFHSLLALFTAGISGMTLSNDLFNIFVFLELSSISAYSMVALQNTKLALQSSFDYLMVGAIGASFYLLGVGVVFLDTGILNISLLGYETIGVNASVLAMTFITIGLAIKAAVFPLHTWVIKAYRHAPLAFCIMSGAIFTKVIVWVMFKVMLGINWNDLPIAPRQIMLYFGLTNMLCGAFFACQQTSWRSIIAYSSISQLGYIITGLAIGSPKSVGAAIITITMHTFIQIGLFAISRSDDNGIVSAGKQSIVIIIAVVILLTSIVGIPGTAGFVAKWLLVYTAVSNKMWLAVVCISASSAMAVGYCTKLVEQICGLKIVKSCDAAPIFAPSAIQLGVIMLLVVTSCAVIVVIGIYPKPITLMSTIQVLRPH